MSRARCRITGLLRLAGGLIWILAIVTPCEGVDYPVEQLDYRLCSRLEAGSQLSSICGDRLEHPELLADTYANRGFDPIWVTPSALTDGAGILLRMIRDIDGEGLEPADYHFDSLSLLSALTAETIDADRQPEPWMLIDLEVLLSDAFVSLMSDLAAGRPEADCVRSDWPRQAHGPEIWARIAAGLTGVDPRRLATELRPRDAAYDRLRRSLAAHRRLLRQGGWPQVASVPLLKVDVYDPRVSALRSRLRISGDLASDPTCAPDCYDEELAAAVHTFQVRHGLAADGMVGPATLAALNVPVADRLRQIELNLERWRVLPRDFGDRHILINVPAFRLQVIEGGQEIMRMPIIVGRKKRPTPIFSAAATYMEFNPYWNIPQKLAIRDILPHVRENPSYLQERNIRVYQSWSPQAPELAAETIDWLGISPWDLPYKFRQEPSPENALGRIKFMFPNEFAVYLHDTPEKHLFDQATRCFSSGCVRIAKPIELAEYLMQGSQGWTREKIVAAIERRGNTTVGLPAAVPVHIVYLTAWVDESGATHFREDVYGRDRRLAVALHRNPDSPAQLVAHSERPIHIPESPTAD